jgi:hypothetical protein
MSAQLVTTSGTVDVLSFELSMPRYGAWVVRGLTDADALATGAASLVYGSTTLVGTLRERPMAQQQGAQRFELVGGAGGLQTVLTPRSYRGAPASTIIGDALGDAGESLSTTSDAALMSGTVERYVRPEGTTGAALRDLVRRIGGTWRMLDDGTVWVGADTWASLTVDPTDVEREDPEAGVVVLTPSGLDARPGRTVLGRRVSHVVHRLAGGKLTSELWLERAEVETTTEDRARAALAALVRHYAPSETLKLYRARVVTQHADGTLDLRLDAASMPTVSRVPLRIGPGLVARVPAGARCLVAFEDGDRAKPVAILGEGATTDLTRIEVRGGTAKVGRVGDAVDVGTLSALANTGTGVVTFTWQPPGTPPPTPIVTTSLPLEGLIADGAEALRA